MRCHGCSRAPPYPLFEQDKLGYKYIVMDDCWSSKNRSATGELMPEPSQFPNGLKAVADYVHSKGFYFGLYTCVGTESERVLRISTPSVADCSLPSEILRRSLPRRAARLVRSLGTRRGDRGSVGHGLHQGR